MSLLEYFAHNTLRSISTKVVYENLRRILIYHIIAINGSFDFFLLPQNIQSPEKQGHSCRFFDVHTNCTLITTIMRVKQYRPS